MDNKYITLTEQEYATRFPYNSLIDTSTLNNEQLNTYLNFYSFYSNLALRYLMKELPLYEYDQYFLNSELKYKEVPLENMDMYQKIASPMLHYFYIRNNFYLNRLTDSERQIISNRMSAGNFSLDEEVIKVLHDSIPRVIVEDENQNQKSKAINFGPINPRFIAPANALIIGFRFDQFDYNGLSDHEWGIFDIERRKDIGLTLNNMEKEIKERFNMPFSIIQYDDFSAKTIPSNNINQL